MLSFGLRFALVGLMALGCAVAASPAKAEDLPAGWEAEWDRITCSITRNIDQDTVVVAFSPLISDKTGIGVFSSRLEELFEGEVSPQYQLRVNGVPMPAAAMGTSRNGASGYWFAFDLTAALRYPRGFALSIFRGDTPGNEVYSVDLATDVIRIVSSTLGCATPQ